MIPRLFAAAMAFLIGSVSPATPIKIACIGDSITQGSGLGNPSVESYPVRLQRLLGTNYLVRNYGVSGRTLLKRGDFPYWKESAYTQSRAWEPDLVTIKLGTNDSKPQNWRYGTNFVADFNELIDSYLSLPSQPRVILCTPAPVFRNGAFDINPNIVATEIAPAIRALATERGLETVDFHERLAGHPEWFPDTVHPNTRGMAVMAAVLFDHLQPPISPVAAPEIAIERLANRRTRTRWPADRGGWVLQSATTLASASTVWTVADPVPYSDGHELLLTNPVSPRFLRLWRP